MYTKYHEKNEFKIIGYECNITYFYLRLKYLKSTKSRNPLISRNSHISILRMRRQKLTSTTSAISDKLCILISPFSFIFVIIVLFLGNASNSIDFETPIKNVNVIYTKRILSKTIVTIFFISSTKLTNTQGTNNVSSNELYE